MKRFLVLSLVALALIGGSVEAASVVIKGRPATFRANSPGETFEWTFPGGEKLSGKVVQYTFKDAGAHKVNLKTKTSAGENNEITKSVMVYNMDKPTASIDARMNGVTIVSGVLRAKLGDSINLSARPFGVAGLDSGAFVETWKINGREYSPNQISQVFNRVGSYQVMLVIKDPDKPHLQDQDTLRVIIENQPPSVNSLTFSQTSQVPGQIILKAAVSDVDGHVVSYKFDILEQGRLFLSQAVSQPQAYFDLSRYPGSHVYSFRVTVTDDRYARTTFDSSQSFAFEKESFNTPPEVNINAVPGNQGDIDTMFTFFAETSDKDKDFLRYEWKLQDGRRFYAPKFQYRFSEPGDQTILLKVSDGIDTVETSLVVSVIKKEVIKKENFPPKIRLRGILPSQKGNINTVFRFYLTAEDPEADQLEYNWDMGDGGRMFIQNPAYRYKKPGKYKIKMTVSDGINEVAGIADVIVDRVEQEKPPTLEEEALQKEVELLKAKTAALKKVKIAAPANTESIEKRISELALRAEEAKAVALEKQKTSRQIALEEQVRKRKQLEKLTTQLEKTQEERARLSLENKIKKVEEELEILRRASTEKSVETTVDDLQKKLLKNELAALKQKIIAEQKSYFNEKITIVKEEKAKEVDSDKKFALGLQIQEIQRFLASKDLLGEFATNYKNDLLERRAVLEKDLEAAEDMQTKILLEGQITSIDLQLKDLERLEKIKINLAQTQEVQETGLGDEVEFEAYLKDRVQELLKEKDQVEQRLDIETDSVEAEVLKLRLSEIQSLLERLGYVSSQEIDVSRTPLAIAKRKVTEKNKKVSTLIKKEKDGETAKRLLSKNKDLITQIKTLRRLDKSGLSPDMAVYDLRGQLEDKKMEIVNNFRAERDLERLEILRSKILILDDSLKILNQLEDSGVNEDNTLEEAQRALANRRLQLTRTYIGSKSETDKKALLKSIQATTAQQQLLQKFYDPGAREMTIGDAKSNLSTSQDELNVKLSKSETNDQKIFFKNKLKEVDHDLIIIKRIENTLREIIKSDFESELEKHRSALRVELEGVTDEETRRRLQSELDNMDIDALRKAALGEHNYFENLMADLVISTNTKLFLYGQSIEEHEQAIFFEWSLGDSRVLSGQNISFKYRDPGFYRVKLKISDGLTETEDSLTIKVMSEAEKAQLNTKSDLDEENLGQEAEDITILKSS